MLAVMLLLGLADVRVLAVLEFRSKLDNEKVDTSYLTDQVRAAALETGPSLRVITRENLLTLLRASGKDLSDCEGECEVDTGRRVGADIVISGELLKFGTSYKLNMRLHDTREGTLLSAATAAGTTFDELDRNLAPSVQKLLAPVFGTPRAQQQQQAPQAPAAPARRPISITLKNNEGGTFSFSVQHAGGTSRCPKPLSDGESCYLAPVEAGQARVQATGTAAFEGEINIPEQGGTFTTYKMGPGALIVGAVLVAGGVPLGLAGLNNHAFSDPNAGFGPVFEATMGAVMVGSGVIAAIVWLALPKGYQILPEPGHATAY